MDNITIQDVFEQFLPTIADRSFSMKQNVHTQEPNLQSVKAVVNGTVKRIKVCAKCLKNGKVKRVS